MATLVETEKLTIEEELEVIAEKHNGFVRPIDVVEYASDPDTALHNEFEWDDTEAARKYRLHQARNILHVYVRMETPPGKESEVRVFVSLPSNRNEEGGYRPTARVMNDKEARAELLELALAELRSFRNNRRFKLLTELQDVWNAIDRVLKKYP